MESILSSVKKILGIVDEYKHFDSDLILHINSVLAILNQLGVGPKEGFFIEDDTSVWSDFINNNHKIDFIKTYVALKVRLIFDPPASSAVMDAINRTISELEWRILLETGNQEQ